MNPRLVLAASTRGFTLIELLVALAIVAIISAVAIPLYTQYSERTFRTEAQGDLLACAQALERQSSMNFNYLGTADTDADGAPDADNGAIASDICDALSVEQDRYDITIAVPAGGQTFTLTATPDANGAMAGDGVMTLDDAGNRTWDENGGGIGAGENDWIEGNAP